ncbi:porin [Allopusillimonas ginsengisoli]|uniref:porin n=1 Tax=Allopusillimonas ginsengisoli TaxID=453575 RepID=UPI0010C1A836|nr:porin [Allopusillimonas ginsengisoli]
MKKTLLAAALIVGFAGVAQAETSVTLYGILDGGIGYQRIKDSNSGDKITKTGMIDGVQSGNRWGLKGTEDLGNGLRAVFQLESGFGLRDGQQGQGGRLFGRQATLGLASDAWGQLDLGRQTNIASKYFPGIGDPFGASFGQANAGASFTSANTVRYDNMVMYQTPNFSGFQFGVGYSFNTSAPQDWKVSGVDDTNNKGITTGLRYANGPIGVALVYDRVENDFTDTTTQAWALGASYDFEVVKLHLGYGQTKDGFFAGQNFPIDGGAGFAWPASAGVDGLKFNSYVAGVSAPLGNGKIMASWQMADPRHEPTGVDLEKQQVYSLGYTYNLSKRTNVYAIGSYAKNAFMLDNVKSTLVGVGVRHQF